MAEELKETGLDRLDGESFSVRLVRDDYGLALVGDGMELRGDFSRMLPRLRQGRLQQELLVKAARIKGVEAPTAVDCTAGLGEDSLLLAAAGFTVTLFAGPDHSGALRMRDTSTGRPTPG